MQNKRKDPSRVTFGGVLLHFVALLTFVAILGYGWVHNIILLMNSADVMSTSQFVVHVAGIPFAPLGVVMGYIGI